MKSRQIFHVEIRHRIDDKSTRMCPFSSQFLDLEILEKSKKNQL